MEIRLVQGHCDLFEVSSKGSETETQKRLEQQQQPREIKSRDTERNRVKRGLQLSELISSITQMITIRQLSRQRGPRVTQNNQFATCQVS